MLYQIKSYLRFLRKSTNQHGVHSPFVFDLVTKCFYDHTNYDEYFILKKHRQKLLNSIELIEVKDLGAGSRVFKSDVRKVSSIARNAGITQKRQLVLFRLARYLKPDSMLELGTSLGMGTMALALGQPQAKLFTVEGCPNTSAKALKLFDSFNLKHIRLKIQPFDHFLADSEANFDLVYLDGNHDKESTIRYFELLLKGVTNDSVIIFDDIYWSREMTEAWEEIRTHERVTVSIDTFQWGLIFFRREQEKQHFRIRM